MTILKEISVKTGSYVGKDGKERGRYVTIGHLHSGQHGDYLTFEAHINLAAFPRKDGDSRVMANLYDPKPRDGDAPRNAPMRTDAPQMAADFEDSEIPF